MTPAEVWQAYASSVARVDILRGEERVSSGTGFVVGDKLVTCEHVVNVNRDLSVKVIFEQAAAGQTRYWRYPHNGTPWLGSSTKNSFDYAILKCPPDGVLPHGFEWSEELPTVGEEVCTLGYPFEEPHLTLHHGYVSSVHQSGVATMLKLDMSVNPSNSGGPLLRLSDGKVLGVVARKATGLTKAFDGLCESFDNNLAAFNAASKMGTMHHMGIDVMQTNIAVQSQLKQVSAEIARSANVGIGYAIWNEPLRDEVAFAIEADQK